MWLFLSTLTLVAYVLLWWQFPSLPFQDLPNHITRSAVILGLITEGSFQEFFSFTPQFKPYILGDIVLAYLLKFLTLERAGMFWVSIAFLSPLIGIFVYARVRKFNDTATAFVLIVCTYLASHWYFLTGYASYCIGVGMTLLTLAAGESALNAMQGWRTWRAVGCTLLFYFGSVTCYLMHLASFFFLMIIFGSVLCLRFLAKRVSLPQAALFGAPLAILLAYHLVQDNPSDSAHNAWEYPQFVTKIVAVGTMFIRFNKSIDIALFIVFTLITLPPVIYCLRQLRLRDFFHADEWWGSRELLAIALMLALSYVALPWRMDTATDVDRRALPFFFFFLVLIVGNCWARLSTQRFSRLSFALLLTVSNLFYLIHYLEKHHQFLEHYHEARRAIPPGKVVLPIVTRPDEGRIQSAAHPGLLYVISGNGLTPYLFSENLAGAQFSYFRYNEDRYTPAIFWYLRNEMVDWNKIRDTYDYLFVTLPFDEARFPMSELETAYANESAALLQFKR